MVCPWPWYNGSYMPKGHDHEKWWANRKEKEARYAAAKRKSSALCPANAASTPLDGEFLKI